MCFVAIQWKSLQIAITLGPNFRNIALIFRKKLMETQPVKRLHEHQRPAGTPGGNLEGISVAGTPAAHTQGSVCD